MALSTLGAAASNVLPPAKPLAFQQLPLVDLSGCDKDWHKPAKQIAAACREVGFFYISGHGVAASVIGHLLRDATAFFSLPESEKQRVLIDHRIRGYLPLNYQSYPGEARQGISRQEGFWIGHEQDVDPARPLQGPNQWPCSPQSLRPSMLTALDALSGLAETLLKLFSLALDLDEYTLSEMFASPTSRLKVNHYPPQEDPRDERDIGVVPHSDSGAFTILWQDDKGGLEVMNGAGEWVAAAPLPGTFVVNIGNIMQYWSNGRFTATTHRVVNRSGQERYSVPLFVNPDPSMTIHPLVDVSRHDFAPFRYGDYQLDLWRKTFPVANVPSHQSIGG